MKRKLESVNDTKPLTDEEMRPLDFGITEFILYVLWRDSQTIERGGLSSEQVFREAQELHRRWSQGTFVFTEPMVRRQLFELVIENNVVPIFTKDKNFNLFRLAEHAEKDISECVFKRKKNSNYADRRIRIMFICDLSKTLLG